MRGTVQENASTTNGYEWTFSSDEAYLAQGADLLLTWNMRRDMRNTPCGDHIMAEAALSASNPWKLQVRFIHPYQFFDGNATVEAAEYRIRKRIPLGNLQPSSHGLHYRLQMGVVHQDAPTCMVYQEPSIQDIAFSQLPRRGSTPPDDDRRGGDRRDDPRRGREPLRWSSPITAANLGQEPHPEVLGKSLADIVNSAVEARPDGNVCSACHHGNTAFDYRPSVDQGVATPGSITPSTSISRDGSRSRSGVYRWNEPGPTGIIEAFSSASPAKPDYLKDVLAKWAADGYQP